MQDNNLAEALVSLVRDLDPGLALLVPAVCYLLGLLAFFQGAARLLKTSEDRFHAPSAAGTALSFLVCAVMVAFPSWLAGAGESLFGTGRTAAGASLGYRGRGTDYDALLGAVLAIVAWAGLFAFLRGAFVLRAAADGAPGATRRQGVPAHARRRRRLAHDERDRSGADHARHPGPGHRMRRNVMTKAIGLAVLGAWAAARPALAVSLGDMAQRAASDLEAVPAFLAIGFYIVGAGVVGFGLLKLKRHVDTRSRPASAPG